MPSSNFLYVIDTGAAGAPTRREFIGLLAAAGLVTACGNDDDESADVSGADGGSGSIEEITVSHAGGETVFDAVPERIVILDPAMLGDLLSFGVLPIGTAGELAGPTVIEQWQDEAGTSEIANISPDFEPNLEALAELRPDVIFAMAFQVDDVYWDELQQIAPVVAVETDVDPDALDERFDEIAMRTYAEVFRDPGAVDEVVADYEMRVAAIRAEFGDLIDRTVISTAQLREATMVADFSGGWQGAILDDLGFTFPQQQLDNPMSDFRPFRAEFSLENTEEFLGDADVIIYFDFARTDLSVERGFPGNVLEANPLLETLPAHRADHVWTVADQVWFLRSLRGRSFVLDQLENEILPMLRAST